MSPNLLNTVYLAITFLVLFGSAEVLYHVFKVRVELTRKYVHVATGILTLLFPIMIQDPWLVLFLCGSFLVILLLSLFFKLLPSINAVDRKTRGSVLYPIIVYVCYLIQIDYGLIYYYIPILILALCDPVAALVGKKWPMGKYKTFGQTKTLSGSFGFFVTAMITSLLIILSLKEMNPMAILFISLVTSFITTIAEAFTHKGYDNLTIPGSAVFMLWIFETYLNF